MPYNPVATEPSDNKWYAAKIFLNRTNAISDSLEKRGIHIYRQSIAPSFIFIHCDEETILKVREDFRDKLYIYQNVAKTKLYAIPEAEMASFILVTSTDYSDLTFLGEDKAEYHQGDRVRVKEGPFKGAEGHIKRIKRDRKLIVSINGVAAVAIAYIPPQLLEKVEPATKTQDNAQTPPPGSAQ